MGLKAWARTLRRDAHALWLAGRDPRTPWYAKVLALAVAGYAFSPIDLIPDFIPVLGYLDDLILVPIGLWLALKLVPAAVLAEHRATADKSADKPVSKMAALCVVCVWLIITGVTAIAVLG
ncbi:YkvA family protein [Phenylobacterium sp.]|jgi:uncharacterized membrane protein YkvA (DUF1232 family)|uniref:YkvA family protein n=1 Tax=Phenylobacterium sp. TaxID=1871053 RepID=UPI002F936C4E